MSSHNALIQHQEGPWDIKDPGTGVALPNDTTGIVNIVTGASGETNTIPVPQRSGVELTLLLLTDGGGDRVITFSAAIDEYGTTVVTLADAGDFITVRSMKFGTAYRWRRVASNGIAVPTFDQVLADDATLGFGAPDVEVLWETADANANNLLVQLPAGTAVNVPVIVIGQAIENVDMAIHNGQTEPLICIVGTGAVTTAPIIEFRKARGTATAPTAITTADDLGSIDAYSCVAAGEWVRSAQIRFDSTGTIATTRGPGVISMSVGIDSAPSTLTERLLITASGQINLTPATDLTIANGTGLIVGHTAQVAVGAVTPELQVLGTAPADSTMTLQAWSADAVPPRLYFAKSRSATIGTFSIITTGDNLGEILAFGDDGVDFNSNANASCAIVFDSAGTIAADRIAGVILPLNGVGACCRCDISHCQRLPDASFV